MVSKSPITFQNTLSWVNLMGILRAEMKTDPTYSDPAFSAGRRLLAWGVHIFTASGVVMGLLALAAVVNRNWRGALLWLFVAVLIDTVDGSLARVIRVKEVLPDVDGRMLDYVIDFTNDVIVPTLLVYTAGLVPPSIRLICCGAMLLVRSEERRVGKECRSRWWPYE